MIKKNRLLSWVGVAVWMAVIFLFSAQTADDSGNMSGSVVRWVVGLLFRRFDALPELRQAELLKILHTLIRKGAHFTEYAILAMLAANATRPYPIPGRKKWLLPVGVSALYAVTDEIHQYFVPGRACRLLDVGIDTCGAIFGMVVYTIVVSLWRRIKAKNTAP